MKLTSLAIVPLAAFTLTACGTDDPNDNNGGGDDRGGPDALAGVSWHTTFTDNGIDFDFSFAFDDAKVSAVNKCSLGGQSLTASTASMVKYRYDANVPKAGHAGSDACFIDIAAGKFSFEIAGDKLIMTSSGQTVTFTQTGTHSGLYGDWTGMANGFTITWSMGHGKIHATATCPDGTASTDVSAQFTNFVDILEDKSQTEGDDSFNCTVSISKSMAEYHFSGDDLVMTVGGKSLTFHK
jgi:hypothetical protein